MWGGGGEGLLQVQGCGLLLPGTPFSIQSPNPSSLLQVHQAKDWARHRHHCHPVAVGEVEGRGRGLVATRKVSLFITSNTFFVSSTCPHTKLYSLFNFTTSFTCSPQVPR